MVSPKLLLSTIESALLGPSPPTPYQRIELMHAIRSSLPSFRSLLSYPPPKASDHSQVQSKEVRLPDSRAISLNDQDVQIKLNREEPAGFGGPQAGCYVLDCRGALVERRDVVCRERLSLGHCLVLSVLITRTSQIQNFTV